MAQYRVLRRFDSTLAEGVVFWAVSEARAVRVSRLWEGTFDDRSEGFSHKGNPQVIWRCHGAQIVALGGRCGNTYKTEALTVGDDKSFVCATPQTF